MNERVKELAEQAGFVSWSDEEWKPEGAVIDWSSDYDNELAKFAELIVQDCVAQIALIGISNFEHEDIAWTVETSIDIIKSRFGVE